ncbi:MAG: hypothetical protein GY793_02430 [Proteobacteria bacterium]|nr:hypothetical protein [Pseudomonadota bacterium]
MLQSEAREDISVFQHVPCNGPTPACVHVQLDDLVEINPELDPAEFTEYLIGLFKQYDVECIIAWHEKFHDLHDSPLGKIAPRLNRTKVDKLDLISKSGYQVDFLKHVIKLTSGGTLLLKVDDDKNLKQC